MPTTSEILGWTPQEKAAAIFTAAGEAGPGSDALGVLQTIATRKVLSGGNVASLVKAPQQFVANDRYSLKQVTDPEFGRKVHGSRYQQIEQMLEDPMQMAKALQAAQGATQFRGQSLLSAKKKDDVMFDPKGNFYFQKNPSVAKDLANRLVKGSDEAPQQATGRTFVILDTDAEKAGDFLGTWVNNLIAKGTPKVQSGIDPVSILSQAMAPTQNYFEEN